MLQNCVVIYRQLFLTFIASKDLKLFFFTLNYVIKHANDFKAISNWIVLLSTCFRNLKPFQVNKNGSWAPQTHSRLRYNKYLTNLVFSVHTVSYGSSFFPFQFMARTFRAWAINRGGKNSVHNLQYGPQTWLVRGMYILLVGWDVHIVKNCDLGLENAPLSRQP